MVTQTINLHEQEAKRHLKSQGFSATPKLLEYVCQTIAFVEKESMADEWVPLERLENIVLKYTVFGIEDKHERALEVYQENPELRVRCAQALAEHNEARASYRQKADPLEFVEVEFGTLVSEIGSQAAIERAKDMPVSNKADTLLNQGRQLAADGYFHGTLSTTALGWLNAWDKLCQDIETADYSKETAELEAWNTNSVADLDVIDAMTFSYHPLAWAIIKQYGLDAIYQEFAACAIQEVVGLNSTDKYYREKKLIVFLAFRLHVLMLQHGFKQLL